MKKHEDCPTCGARCRGEECTEPSPRFGGGKLVPAVFFACGCEFERVRGRVFIVNGVE